MYVRLGLYGQVRAYNVIMIGSSTYVGMITVRRASQAEKAPSDMVTREVGRDRLVRAKLAKKEKRRREEKSATWSTIDRL